MRAYILFFGLACSASLMLAQQDPTAFVSAGRGLELTRPMHWEPRPNTNVSLGYRIFPGLMLCGYADFNSFSFQGEESPSSTGSYSLTSFFFGAKVYATIPGNRASPYFIGAVGSSMEASDQDTLFTHHHGNLIVYHVNRSPSLAFFGAIGSDVRIYEGLFCFGELRVSWKFLSIVSGLSMTARAGIGFNVY